jgi:polyisoprenoid-binding protein YceI
MAFVAGLKNMRFHVAAKKTPLMAGVFALAVLLSAGAAELRPHALAQPDGGKLVLSIDPAKSKVRWSLGSTLHTVHGSFAVTRGQVQFDQATGSANGEIVVDAKSGESGNDSRDKKMHGEILESNKFAEIQFHPQRIAGKLTDEKMSILQVHGVFVLHGGEHEMDVPVEAKITGEHWSAMANFKVPYIQWGLKNPGTFLLKVKPEVEIELEFAGNLANGAHAK